LHRHKEAFEQAQEGIKLTHLIIRDSISVCHYYSRRIDFQAHFGDPFGDLPEESISNKASSVANKSKQSSRTGSKIKKQTDRAPSPSKPSHYDEDLESGKSPFTDDRFDEQSIG